MYIHIHWEQPKTKHTIGSPLQTACNSGNEVNLPQGAVIRPQLLEPVEGEHKGDAHREAQQQPFVLAVFAKHLDGTDGAPEHRRGEECVWAGASEAHGRVERADAADFHLHRVSTYVQGIEVCIGSDDKKETKKERGAFLPGI